jgi:hypothetical protein
MEQVPGQAVAAFLQVAHALAFATIGFVVHQGEHVQGLGDAPVGGDRLAEPVETPAAGQHPQNVAGGHGTGVDRGHHPQMSGQCRRTRSSCRRLRAVAFSGP